MESTDDKAIKELEKPQGSDADRKHVETALRDQIEELGNKLRKGQ
jgi:hypothetical protein